MSKKSRSEGNRVAMAIKANKSDFYISDVDLEDNVDDVSSAAQNIRKTLGKLTSAFLIISAGVDKLIIVADVPEVHNVSAKEFLLASIKGISSELSEDSTDTYAKAIVEVEMPFKLKDTVRGLAFAYLRKIGKIEEESEEEEVFYEF
jgi:hypothetical protein